MRLEHLLSGAQTNDEVIDTENDKGHSQRSLASRKTVLFNNTGGLAQLARALAWHARGHRFDPDILHFESQPSGCTRSLTYWTTQDSLREQSQ